MNFRRLRYSLSGLALTQDSLSINESRISEIIRAGDAKIAAVTINALASQKFAEANRHSFNTTILAIVLDFVFAMCILFLASQMSQLSSLLTIPILLLAFTAPLTINSWLLLRSANPDKPDFVRSRIRKYFFLRVIELAMAVIALAMIFLAFDLFGFASKPALSQFFMAVEHLSRLLTTPLFGPEVARSPLGFVLSAFASMLLRSGFAMVVKSISTQDKIRPMP